MKKFLLLFLCWPCASTFSQSWTPLATTGTVGGRANASSVYIPSRNEVIVFGGLTSNGFSYEIWTLNLNNNNWTLFPVKSSKIPAARYTHVAMYDSLYDRMLMWSGQGSALYNDVWAFNFKDSTWAELFADGNVSGAPLKRYGTATAFDPFNRNIITFAGFTTSGRFEDTWAFNVDAKSWTEKTNAIIPEKRCLTSQCFAPDRNEMIVYGGQNVGNLNDIWSLNAETYTWTNLTPTLKPTGRHFSSSVYAGKGHVIIFGGDSLGQGNTAGAMNDLWSFDLNNKIWKLLPQANSKPSPRYGHASIYIPSQDKLIVYGGRAANTYDDTWVLTGLKNVLGLNDSEENTITDLQCLPNPSDGKARLIIQLSKNEKMEVTLYNLIGSVVGESVTDLFFAGSNTIDLEKFQLSPGLYFVKVQGASGSKSLKIIIH